MLLTGCTTTTAPDDPQTPPPDVVAEIQAEMDDLTAGALPPGMIMWIDASEYRFEGASGSANLTDDTLARYVYGKDAQFEPGTQ